MQDLIDNAIAVLRGILRFHWTVLFVSSLIAIAGWTYVFQMKDVYQANARVFVDTNRVLPPLLKGVAVQPDLSERVRLMSRTLLSRPNLKRIVMLSGVDTEAMSGPELEALLGVSACAPPMRQI